MSHPLTCYIYRSERKVDTYLYLSEKDNFSVVPDELLSVFGEPEFSFEFQLSHQRTLAKEDPIEVFTNLRQQGYHLQMPDDLLIEQQLALRSLN